MAMEALRWRALELVADLRPSAANLARIGEVTSPEAARWAFAQTELRRRARTKFRQADEMLFVREALEQATHEGVAAYHASVFAASGAEGGLIADLTCGIGGDLIALARVGNAVGFEVDGERAECARHNVAVYSLSAEVREASCLDHLSEFRFAFADPARRVEGRRTLDLAEFQPDVDTLAQAFRGMSLGGIKLSPLLADPDLEGLGGRLEFVSYAGECREALVWLGDRAGDGIWAVQAETGARLPSGERPGSVNEAGAWILEADPAAIRAHVLSAFGFPILGDSTGYLTASDPPDSTWYAKYEVAWDGSWHPRKVQDALSSLGARAEVAKSRVRGLNLESECKKLRSAGDRKLTLIFYAVGSHIRAALAERKTG